MHFLDKLAEIERKYDELTAQLGDPVVLADQSLYQKTAKAHSELREVVEKYREWKGIRKGLEETKSLLEEASADLEMKALAHEELSDLEKRRAEVEEQLKFLLLPKDPNDEKNVVLEIRAGTGGDEASLFAQEIFRMYNRYAETQGWRVEVLSTSLSGIGGIKEVIALIEGQKVYSKLKYESGVHRVQRVPATEQQGRIHTSAITVAVLPEADEVEIEIDPKDIRIDTFCSSGPGGQSVNTTYSAVRLTHLPTGMVVSCQDEKSQIKNRAKALARAALASLRDETPGAAEADHRRAPLHGRHGRPKREDPDLQLPPESPHRSPHRTYHSSARPSDGWKDRRRHRGADRILSVGEVETAAGGSVRRRSHQ